MQLENSEPETNTIFLIRGLPGAGKTSLAEHIYGGMASIADRIVAADDWFEAESGEYVFDPRFLHHAHEYSQRIAREALESGNNVVVHNTFSQRWEMQAYIDMSVQLGARLVVIDLFDAGMDDVSLARRCEHGVSTKVINKMRSRWEHDWRNGDPTEPWLREDPEEADVLEVPGV